MSIIRMSKRTLRGEVIDKSTGTRVCSCDPTKLYWGKEDGAWVLIDANESTKAAGYRGRISSTWKHKHQPKGSTSPVPYKAPEVEVKAPEVEVKPEPVPAPVAPSADEVKHETPDFDNVGPELSEVQRQAQKLFGIDPDTLKRNAEDAARNALRDVVFPVKTVVVDSKKRDLKRLEGTTHYQLADVIAAVTRGYNVLMVGPTASGKSRISQDVSKALDLPYYSIGCSATMSDAKFLGYMLPSGYFRSAFRNAYEHGGVFNVDEIDASNPGVLMVLNEATSNGVMSFPDGMVKKHKDFHLIASANTYGLGATREYVGRQAIDKATKNRFIVMTIKYDEALETSMCHATGANATTVDKVLTFVRKLRKNADARGIKIILSPRQTVAMVDMLTAGWTWDMVIDNCLRMGEISDADWAKVQA